MKTLLITKAEIVEAQTVVHFSILDEAGTVMDSGTWIEKEMPELAAYTQALLALGLTKVAPDETDKFVVKVDFNAPTPASAPAVGNVASK